MKTLLILLLGLLAASHSYAQNAFPTTGNVLIGTTTDNGLGKLQVNGNINASGLLIKTTEAGGQSQLIIGAPNDGRYYNGIGIYSQYKTTDYTWLLEQDYMGNILTAGLNTLFFTVGSGAKIIHFDSQGTGTFGGSVNAFGSISVGNNSGNTTNRINLAGSDANHYIYSSGTSGNNLYFGELLSGASTGFHWVNTSNNTDVMTLNGSGNLGIGTNTPSGQLEVWRPAINGIVARFATKFDGGQALDFKPIQTSSGNGYFSFDLSGSTTGWQKIIIPVGYVGIGTTQPDQALTVNGTIHSTQVLVDQTIKTPDYVFDKDYDLSTLKDVKTYIDKNHHLPEIPSAAQVAKEGINLGEMNMKLLKKIEELTLYLIEKDQVLDRQGIRLQAQQQINDLQQQQINELKVQLSALQHKIRSKKH